MSRGCKKLEGVEGREEDEAACSLGKAGRGWAEEVAKETTAWWERTEAETTKEESEARRAAMTMVAAGEAVEKKTEAEAAEVSATAVEEEAVRRLTGEEARRRSTAKMAAGGSAAMRREGDMGAARMGADCTEVVVSVPTSTNPSADCVKREVCLPLRPRCLWTTGPLGPVVLSSRQRRESSRDVHAGVAEAVRFGPYWGQIEQEGPAAVAARCPSEQLSGPSRPRTTAHARHSPCRGKPWVADLPGLPAALPAQTYNDTSKSQWQSIMKSVAREDSGR